MRERMWLPILLLTVSACGKKDPVLARVGTRSVTASDFKKEVAGVPFSSQTYLRTPSGRKELLELLVRRKIILEEAKSSSTAADTKKLFSELDKQYEEQRKRLRESFLEERERLRVAQYMKTLKEGPLKITDDDIRSFWEREKEVHAAHILVSDRALAEEIRKKIASGESFSSLAKKYSEDAPSAARGGDAGYLLPGSLVPEFENALFLMKKGDISDVVVSPYGFHIIQRKDDRSLSDQPLDEALKVRLRQALESRKLQGWFETIRKKHRVRVNNENLMDVVFPSPPHDPAQGEKPIPG